MNEYLDTVYIHVEGLKKQASLLLKYADAFYLIGNETMGDKLCEISYNIDISSQEIEKTIIDKVNFDYKVAVKNSQELMKGILSLTSNMEKMSS